MNSPAARAAYVFCFGLILNLHTLMNSELLYAPLGGVRPKAMVLIDDAIHATLVNTTGRPLAVAALGLLTLIGTALAYRRGRFEVRRTTSSAAGRQTGINQTR